MATKKVYFCGSMRGGRGDEALYHYIIQTITALGAEVLTEFVGWNKNQLEGNACLPTCYYASCTY